MSESIYPIISRKEAKEQGLKFYFTGKPCKHGHVSARYAINGMCMACNRGYTQHEDKKRYHNDYYKEYAKSDKCREYQRIYALSDKAKIQHSTYKKTKYTNDPLFKLATNIRSLILNTHRNRGFKKSTRTADILGCSFEEFKLYIEQQFAEGMNWDNHGEWHYDHIYPVSRAVDEAHLIALNHYTNFQPLWAMDNFKKGSKVIN